MRFKPPTQLIIGIKNYFREQWGCVVIYSSPNNNKSILARVLVPSPFCQQILYFRIGSCPDHPIPMSVTSTSPYKQTHNKWNLLRGFGASSS